MMRRAIIFQALLIGVLLSVPHAVAWAEDLSTPQAAARSLHEAVKREDADGILAALHGDRDSQKPLLQAFSRLLVASHHFAQVATKAYGKAGDALGADMTMADELQKIDEATVKFTDASTALLTLPGQDRGLTFIRTDNMWKLAVTDYHGAAAPNIAAQVRLLSSITDLLSTTSSGIEAGKYASADAAGALLQARLHQIMIEDAQGRFRDQSPAPTSAPTSRPADVRGDRQ